MDFCGSVTVEIVRTSLHVQHFHHPSVQKSRCNSLPAPRSLQITYSTWGHINKLADQVVAGLESVEGVKASRFQVGARRLPPAA